MAPHPPITTTTQPIITAWKLAPSVCHSLWLSFFDIRHDWIWCKTPEIGVAARRMESHQLLQFSQIYISVLTLIRSCSHMRPFVFNVLLAQLQLPLMWNNQGASSIKNQSSRRKSRLFSPHRVALVTHPPPSQHWTSARRRSHCT